MSTWTTLLGPFWICLGSIKGNQAQVKHRLGCEACDSKEVKFGRREERDSRVQGEEIAGF